MKMIKSGIDQDAIVKMFSEATTKQGEALRKAVAEATLKALQGRELTMENIKKVLKTVTTAATTGAAQNVASPVDVETMLTKAFAGMDGALLQTVEANRRALQQFVDQGTALKEKQLKSAIDNLEKMEDTFFATVTKAVQGVGAPMQGMQGPWEHVLSAMKIKGTETGAQATQTVEQLMEQAKTALRDGRAASAKSAQAMLDGYAALVSGVLIGMSEGLKGGSATAKPAAAKKK
jgi:predicted lactoylglutathione lyase